MNDVRFDVAWCRSQFPALGRVVGERAAAFFDGPAGTQVPQVVIESIAKYLTQCNANHGGRFVTSRESDLWMDEVHQAAADFLGAEDPATVVFGQNMTSLTFSLSRALARTWSPDDEIVVTRLEHDANFTPWVLAAQDAGVTVQYVDIRESDCSLDMNEIHDAIRRRPRFLAVGCASNATGTRNPVKEICHMAREHGVTTFLDAVHFAPHDLIDVQDIDCDFLACSAYKFFGPHQGLLWGRRRLLDEIVPYKLRPAPNTLPGRWMTGTQNHECLAGVMAAIDYLAAVGRHEVGDVSLSRRDALTVAYSRIVDYERGLVSQLIRGLDEIPDLKIWGVTHVDELEHRLPTVAFTHPRMMSEQIATELGKQGFFVWHGNYYALPLTQRIEVEPAGMVRVGIVHYNTSQEVADLIDATRCLLT